MPEIPRALAVARSQLYVVADDPRAQVVARLRILDPTDPTAPVLLGSLPLADARRVGDLVADGAFVHILTDVGLLTVDVKQPRRPRLLRQLPLPGGPERSADVPSWLIESPGGLAREGELLVSAGPSGVHVIDIDDPATPKLLASIEPMAARDVALHGGRAYVLGSDHALIVLSIKYPEHPVLRTVVDLPREEAEGAGHGGPDLPLAIAVHGPTSRAAVLDRDGRRLLLFDLTDPDAPSLQAARGWSAARSRLGGLLWTAPDAQHATADGERLLIASALGGIAWIDPSAPGGPVGRPSLTLVPPLGHLAAAGPRVVAAAGTRGVALLEHSPVGAQAVIQSMDRPWEPWQVADIVSVVTTGGVHADVRRVAASEDGRVAFAWTADHGLAVLSLDPRPGAPARSVDWLPYLPAPSPGAAMQVVAGHLYLIDHDGVLRVIDATDPLRPVQRAALPELHAVDFALHARRLVVLGGAAGDPRLIVLDLADPTRPRALGATTLPESFAHVAFDGRHAFLLDDRAGLAVYGLERPDRPLLLHRHMRFPAGAARVRDGRLLVLGRGGLSVFDVTVPGHPRPSPEDGVPLPDGLVGGAFGARSLTLFEGRVLVAREAAGLYDLPGPFVPDAPPPPPEVAWRPQVRYLPAVFAGPSGRSKPPREAPISLPVDAPACGLDVTLLLDASVAGHAQSKRIDRVAQGVADALAAAPQGVRLHVLRFDRQAQILATGLTPSAALPRRSDFAPASRAGARIDLALVAAAFVAEQSNETTGDRPAEPHEETQHAILVGAALPALADDPDRLARPMAAREADSLRASGIRLHAVALGAEADLAYLHRLTGDLGRLHAPSAGRERAVGDTIAAQMLADRSRCGERLVAGR
jgi:hypothetical protein